MTDINLLPAEEREREQFQQLRQKVSIISTVILILTAVITLIVLVFFTSVASKRKDLVVQVEEGIQEINRFKDTEELVVVAKDKAQLADVLLASRINYFETFNNLAMLIPQGVYFSDVRFGENSISMSGRARSSADLAGFISALISPDGAKVVSSVTIDSLSADETGVYVFSINAEHAGLEVQ